MSAARRGNSRSRRGNKNRKRSGRNSGPASSSTDFWGDEAKLPESKGTVRIARDPAAVVRSLGRPPLQGQETIALHYFEAVYERAVGLAGVLAAAGDLIEPEELLADNS